MEILRFIPGQEFITKTFTTGLKIEAEIELPKPIVASDTANHEAKHIVAAGEIEQATIIPNGNALGITRPRVMTAAAAAAPASDGHDGHSWDRFVTVNYLGVNWDLALNLGRKALEGKGRFVGLVAQALDKKGTIYQNDVDKARKKFENENRGMYDSFIRIISPDGTFKLIQKETKYHNLEINDSDMPIPKSKNIHPSGDVVLLEAA